MNMSMVDLGANIKSYFCGAVYATAAGIGDNTAVTGAEIDRLGYSGCKLIVTWSATLTSAETLSLAVEYQEGVAASTDTATALLAKTVIKTAGSSTTFTGTQEFDIDLSRRKRYIKFNFTPDLSKSGTDTCIIAATAILYGSDSNPITKSTTITI